MDTTKRHKNHKRHKQVKVGKCPLPKPVVALVPFVHLCGVKKRCDKDLLPAAPAPPAARSLKIYSFAVVRLTRTPPFVVNAFTSGPPDPRFTVSAFVIWPCTVTGKSTLIFPLTVPVCRFAE